MPAARAAEPLLLSRVSCSPAIVRRPCENRSVSLKGDVSVLTDVHGQLASTVHCHAYYAENLLEAKATKLARVRQNAMYV